MKKLKEWVKDGNTIRSVLENITKYEEICSLNVVASKKSQNLFYVPHCSLVSINDKHHYEACSICAKKVSFGMCQNCKKPSKTVKRLYIVGTVADESHILPVLWPHEESVELIGEEGSGFQ